MTENTEQFLVLRLQKGSEGAFRKLFDRYRKDIYAYSLSILKSKHQAEEVVQDVFLKVWLNHENLDPSLSFKSYIFTIARNLAFNVLAKAANDVKLKERIFYKNQIGSNMADTQLLEEDYEKLKNRAIDELSPRCKQVFQMSRNDGKSYEQIAKELGISTNTVKNQMSTALASIKEFLSLNGDIVFLFIFLSDHFS
ncbi:RNA polymerase sigma factor [Galbibacter sp.]|jgi:RNA polymerase sigma-70 factor (ECF subfamily)|uniref:RNA polymerase sigma factor n=1 Tax=Galbibacter sp. TaxID=2918471 RepID=UPI003A92BB08